MASADHRGVVPLGETGTTPLGSSAGDILARAATSLAEAAGPEPARPRRRPAVLLAGALLICLAWAGGVITLYARAHGERQRAIALLAADRELQEVETMRWRALLGTVTPLQAVTTGRWHWDALRHHLDRAGSPTLTAAAGELATPLARDDRARLAQRHAVTAGAGDQLGTLLEGLELRIDAERDRVDRLAGRDTRRAWLITIAGGAVALALITLLLRAYVRVLRALRSLAERRRLEGELRASELRDPRTGLPNRWRFEQWLQEALAAGGEPDVAAVLLDLDDFQTINESLGHAAGDRLLTACAERLEGAAGARGRLARLSGDEFALLIEGVREPEAAEQRARALLDALADPVRLDDGEVPLTASVGVALAVHRGRAEDLLRAADTALHAAKRRGAGHVEVFCPAMYEQALRRLELRSALARAVERDELTLAYQPIVDLRGGETTGVEALLRWQLDGVPVPPGDFIGVAEASGLIIPLGAWVLGRACAEVAGRTRACGAPLGVSVNVSAVQLRSPGFVGAVVAALESSGLPPSSLVLELTESAMLDDMAGVQETLEATRALGVLIAVDDFGTGWSSLATLASLPVDVLKLDRSFVAAMDDSPAHAAVVGGVISLADRLELPAVIEGVETAEQLDRLRDLGAGHAQGFHLGRPGPLPVASARCASSRSTAAGSAG